MDQWSGLRTVLTVVVWLTVAGGLLMAAIWLRSGGTRAVGPEDEILSEAGVQIRPRSRRLTSFSSAQLGMHGLLGLLTAALVTYAAAFNEDRTNGYVALVVAVLLTAVPGLAMYLKWHRGQVPKVPTLEGSVDDERVEDHLPAAVVYFHGLGALATLAIVVALFFLD